MGKYSEYKTINLPWLAKIPANWELIRNKQFLREKKDIVGDLSNQFTLLSLTLRGVIKRDLSEKKGKLPGSFDTYKIISPGDIIFCLFDMDETPRTVGLSEYDGMLTGAYTVFQVNGINPQFLYYYYLSLDNIKALRPLYTGLRKTIKTDTFLALKLPVPPRAEQDQIVRFLDWKVSEINRLIGIKKNQINGYREYEKKVINDKVLYGLQEAPLRESGNHWVGKIPTNWKIIKLGKFCSFQNGISESGNFFTSGTPFVGYSDVYKHLELPKYVKGVAKANEQQQEIFSVRKGDIFFTRTSESIEEIGMAAVCKHTIKDAVFSGFLIRCRPRMPLINEDYMKYYLQIPAVRNHFSSMMNIVIRASLGQNLLKQMPVVVPPLKEQKEIAEFLDAMHERFLRLITTNEEEISMLEELRSTLISDVVTGKIDVRNIPVPAYEHVDDMVADGGEGNDEEPRIPGEED